MFTHDKSARLCGFQKVFPVFLDVPWEPPRFANYARSTASYDDIQHAGERSFALLGNFINLQILFACGQYLFTTPLIQRGACLDAI